jgi:hypothetical protein
MASSWRYYELETLLLDMAARSTQSTGKTAKAEVVVEQMAIQLGVGQIPAHSR